MNSLTRRSRDFFGKCKMENLYNLRGKNAWIIGGRRIGQKVGEVLAQHGANLILSYKTSKQEALETVRKIKNNSIRTFIVHTDATSKESVINAVDNIKKNFKKIDIVVLMASVFERIEIMSVTEEHLRKNFDIHVLGTFLPVQVSLNLIPRGGHLITICDRSSIGRTYPNYLPYIVTKGAVGHLTTALAFELASKGIFINSIAPGPILKAENISDKDWQKIRSNSIIDYKITDSEAVNEFAKLVLYLSTVRSTGSIYPLDFGHL